MCPASVVAQALGVLQLQGRLSLRVRATCCSVSERECLHDEVHRSCSFYEEYTCWETAALSRRVKSSPKRLAHCRAGCYCKKGLVRMYPGGRCVVAQACRDLELRRVLDKIPTEVSDV